MFDSAPACQSPLMREALNVHGIDAGTVPATTLRLANARCAHCESADACFAWLAGAKDAEDYHWFCPNARLFDDLTAKAA